MKRHPASSPGAHQRAVPSPPGLLPQATLSQVLRAHQRVLRGAGLDPEVDARYYRTLLRLSLDRAEPNWWGRLYREISADARWVLPQRCLLWRKTYRLALGG